VSKILVTIYSCCVLLFLSSACSCSQAYASTSLWNNVFRKLTPVPYQYAQSELTRNDFEATWQLLQKMMLPEDALVLMSPNADYAVFRYYSPRHQIIDSISHANLNPAFKRLSNLYSRIWVVINNPRLGWHAQPPAIYRTELQNRYMKLPFNLPVFFTDSSISPRTTNFWLLKARMLEQYVTLEPENLNPKVFLELGRLYRRTGKLDTAAEQYNRGLRLFPSDPFLHRALGECYYWQYDPPRIKESITHNTLADYYHRHQYGRPMYDALFNVAITYTTSGEREKALLQYNAILTKLVNFPNRKMESQIRRYLANTYLDVGRTNNAVQQLELDIQLQSQAPGYSYSKILDIYAARKQTNEYAKLVTEFFARQHTNDLRAITRYTSHVLTHGTNQEIIDMINSVRVYIKADSPVSDALREKTAWWHRWTNAANSRSISPVD
jgi:tetratricopeptide (TPR) repeat protein